MESEETQRRMTRVTVIARNVSDEAIQKDKHWTAAKIKDFRTVTKECTPDPSI